MILEDYNEYILEKKLFFFASGLFLLFIDNGSTVKVTVHCYDL